MGRWPRPRSRSATARRIKRLDVVDRERLELEHAAAAHQRAVDGEEGVFGGRADEDHHALFHARQQHVLLGLVEAVDLVDEQQRPLAGGRQPIVGLGEDFPQLLHAAGHRADLAEVAAGGAGQQPGQRGLARARRAVEDHRAQPIGGQQPAQQLSFAQEMPLADELLQRARPHPRRQGLGFPPVRSFAGVKKGHGAGSPWVAVPATAKRPCTAVLLRRPCRRPLNVRWHASNVV